MHLANWVVALSFTGISSHINCGASSFMGVDSLDEMRFDFSLAFPHFKSCYCSSCLPFTSSHHPIFVTSFHINVGKETSKVVVHLADWLVALMLTGIASHVNCGASSFVCVDSLDERRFGFSLGHPSFQRLLLPLWPPVNLHPSTNYHHFLKKQSLITPLASQSPNFLCISQGKQSNPRQFIWFHW